MSIINKLLITTTVFGITACGGGTENSDQRSADASSDRRARLEVDFAVDDGNALALAAVTMDFKIAVKCTLRGSPHTATFTQAQIVAGTASLPQAAEKCFAYPIDVSMNLVPNTVTFNPDPARQITANSFSNFVPSATANETYVQTAPAATADVVNQLQVNLDQALPSGKLNADTVSAKFTVSVLQTQASQGVSATILTNQAKVTSVVSGQNPPAFKADAAGLLAVAANQPASVGRCGFVAQLKCTRDPVAVGGKLASCDGAPLSSLFYTFSQPGVSDATGFLNASAVTLGADSVKVPVEVACSRTGGASETKKGLAFKVTRRISGADAGTVTLPHSLTIGYRDAP